MSDEVRRSSVEVVILSGDETRHVPDSPELRSFLKHMELGCKVLDMRKRAFFFFKRGLKPHEKMIELMRLEMESQ